MSLRYNTICFQRCCHEMSFDKAYRFVLHIIFVIIVKNSAQIYHICLHLKANCVFDPSMYSFIPFHLFILHMFLLEICLHLAFRIAASISLNIVEPVRVYTVKCVNSNV